MRVGRVWVNCAGFALVVADRHRPVPTDALGIRYGPTHGEVKNCREEPVLVEVGARCQGADGFWVDVANECLGYDQASVTVAAATNPEAFAAVPTEVSTVRVCV